MKKFISALVCCFLFLTLMPDALAEEEVLRVYNWQDYIDEGKDDDGAIIDKSVIELWEEDFYKRTGRKVRVQYDMFETNETMLNTFKTGKTSYDLACPSDYVLVDENGTVFVNGTELYEPYVSEKSFGECDIEYPYQVPDSKYFLMGDHRETSVDSRVSVVGCIPEEQIVGKIVFRVWPVSDFGIIE